jgi:hypothetical protein
MANWDIVSKYGTVNRGPNGFNLKEWHSRFRKVSHKSALIKTFYARHPYIKAMTIEDRPSQVEQHSQSVTFASPISTLESPTVAQGSSELIFRVNRAAYRP